MIALRRGRGVTVFGNNMGLNATDLPSAADVINNTNLAAGVRNRFTIAMQREPVRREVAIKVLKPQIASYHVLARFETERQTLARMEHPGIARL